MKKKKLTLIQLRVNSFKTNDEASISKTAKGGWEPTKVTCIVDTIDPTTLDLTLQFGNCPEGSLVQTTPAECG